MNSVNVLHIGGPTVMLEFAGRTFLTDPTLDPPGSYPMPVGSLQKSGMPWHSLDELSGRVDVVLLSHDQHPDNLDVSGRRLLGTVGHVISTPSAASRLAGTQGLEPWATTQVIGPAGAVVTITAVPARHGPAELGPVLGEVTGFLLTAPGYPTIYVSGDNADLENVEEVALRAGRVDLAVVAAGAPQLPELIGPSILGLTASDVLAVADLMPDALIMVVHTEGWSHFTEGPEHVRTAAAEQGLDNRVNVPSAGTRLVVEAGSTLSH